MQPGRLDYAFCFCLPFFEPPFPVIDKRKIFLGSHHELPERRPTGSAHHLGEQPVGALGTVVARRRDKEVRVVEVDRVDLRSGHELLQLDQARTLAGGGVDLVLAEQDVLAPLDLRAVLCVDLVEMDGAVLRRRVDLNRDGIRPNVIVPLKIERAIVPWRYPV